MRFKIMEDKVIEEVDKDGCYTVYMHISPSGKRYIGITSKNPPEKRWKKNGYGYKKNEYFYRAISKYSWSNFKHEILFSGLTKEEAEQKEIELIACYKSDDKHHGYNVAHGGNCKGKVADETKRKISISNIGLGAIPVVKYSRSGEIIKEYSSITIAARENNLSKNAIVNCCCDISKTANDCIWRYANQPLTREHIEWCNKNGVDDRKISVKQYSMSGEFLNAYESITDACLATGAKKSSLSKCCVNKQKSCVKSIWRYADEELTEEYISWCNSSEVENRKRPIMQYSINGDFIKMFDGVITIKRELGFDMSAIIRTCRGDQKTSYGYIWRYVDDKNDEFRKAV